MPKSSENRVQISKYYPVENDGKIVNDPQKTAKEVKNKYTDADAVKGLKLGKNKVN